MDGRGSSCCWPSGSSSATGEAGLASRPAWARSPVSSLRLMTGNPWRRSSPEATNEPVHVFAAHARAHLPADVWDHGHSGCLHADRLRKKLAALPDRVGPAEIGRERHPGTKSAPSAGTMARVSGHAVSGRAGLRDVSGPESGRVSGVWARAGSAG